jgi:integrase
MTTLEIPYVQKFTDRHGKVRHYFRRPGFKRVPLPGKVGSPEFRIAYEAALAAPPIKIGEKNSKPGSVAALVAKYYEEEYQALGPATRVAYGNIIGRWRDEFGHLPVARIESEHVHRMLKARSHTPAASNNFLRLLRMLMKLAIKHGMRADDPTAGIKRVKIDGEGFHSWTDEEIAAYEARHPVGTKARLAFGLLLFTGQRLGDVVRMGRQQLRNGAIHVRQRKTGAEVNIPVHPELTAILESTPLGNMTFLMTEYDKPYTDAGFGGWFRDRCDEAGLKGCSAHGLRKAAARKLAEAGCSGPEIMAWTGHKNLIQVQVYIDAYNRKRAAEAALEKLTRTRSVKPTP